MAVVRFDDILQIDHIHAHSRCLIVGFNHLAEAPSLGTQGAEPPLSDALMTPLIEGLKEVTLGGKWWVVTAGGLIRPLDGTRYRLKP